MSLEWNARCALFGRGPDHRTWLVHWPGVPTWVVAVHYNGLGVSTAASGSGTVGLELAWRAPGALSVPVYFFWAWRVRHS